MYPTNIYQKCRDACFHSRDDSDRVCRLFSPSRQDFILQRKPGAREASDCRISFFVIAIFDHSLIRGDVGT